jgi:hypothetical protein
MSCIAFATLETQLPRNGVNLPLEGSQRDSMKWEETNLDLA